MTSRILQPPPDSAMITSAGFAVEGVAVAQEDDERAGKNQVVPVGWWCRECGNNSAQTCCYFPSNHGNDTFIISVMEEALREDMVNIEDNIGYRFKNPAFLTQALTRKAFANEERHQGRHHDDQEILCTLGDAVLKTVFVELLIRARYPTPDAIIQAKIQLEHEEALAGIAGQIGIAPSIRLGLEERKQGVVEKGFDVLAETLKATIGAIYLDGGFGAARDAVIRWYGHRIKPHPR